MNVSYDNTEYDTSSIYEMGESCVRFRTVAKTRARTVVKELEERTDCGL